MPKAIKKKAPKKKPVQEDEMKSAALQAVEKIKDKHKQLITAVAAAVILIVLAVVYFTYSSSLKSRAYSLEREAYNYYYAPGDGGAASKEENLKKALDLFSKSIEIKASPTALFYLGNCYYSLGNFKNAISRYNVFTDKFSSAKGLLPLVYQKLASAHFKAGDSAKGLEALDRLASLANGSYKDTALILKARHYDKSGNPEKALENYKALVSEYPASPWKSEAASRLPADTAVSDTVETPAQPAAAQDAEGADETVAPAEEGDK